VNANWSDDIKYSLTKYNRNVFFKAKVFVREIGYKLLCFKVVY